MPPDFLQTLPVRVGEALRLEPERLEPEREVPASVEEEAGEEERASWGVPALPESRTKRALDVALAAAGLLLSAPLWPIVAAAIKLEDGGPVFFSQVRVGKGGRPFVSHKFRSMSVRRKEPEVPGQAELEDGRVTRVGRLLRATALDELPQLWNILRGDMSLVGPRALVPAERQSNCDGKVRRLTELPGYRERQGVRPGLTGIAQVRVPRNLPHRKKFRYDRLYVRRRSLGLDLRLISRSLWISLRGRWPEVGEATRWRG